MTARPSCSGTRRILVVLASACTLAAVSVQPARAAASLAVEVDPVPASVYGGQELDLGYVLHNTGDEPISRIVPVYGSSDLEVLSGGDGWTCDPDPVSQGRFDCELDTPLGPGDTRDVVLHVRVKPATDSRAGLTTWFRAEGAGIFTRASVSVPYVDASPTDLAASVPDPEIEAFAGYDATIPVTITNLGPIPANDLIRVRFRFSDGFEYGPWETTRTVYDWMGWDRTGSVTVAATGRLREDAVSPQVVTAEILYGLDTDLADNGTTTTVEVFPTGPDRATVSADPVKVDREGVHADGPLVSGDVSVTPSPFGGPARVSGHFTLQDYDGDLVSVSVDMQGLFGVAFGSMSVTDPDTGRWQPLGFAVARNVPTGEGTATELGSFGFKPVPADPVLGGFWFGLRVHDLA